MKGRGSCGGARLSLSSRLLPGVRFLTASFYISWRGRRQIELTEQEEHLSMAVVCQDIAVSLLVEVV